MSEATKQFLVRLNDAATQFVRRATFYPPFSKGRVEMDQLGDTVKQAHETLFLIERLREEEGSSVTFFSDNADFNGQPNCLVICYGSFTGWDEKRFTGDTILECLRHADKEWCAFQDRENKQ
jgi:hypothetical protein